MKKNKKINISNITKQNMREYGFNDGYTGKKSQEDKWIKRFAKKRMNIITIKEYIESYITGYKVAKCTLGGLDNAKIKNGEVYYNNIMINEKINNDVIEQKVKTLMPNKNKKEGK